MSKKSFLLIKLACLVLALSACVDKPTTPLRIGTNVWPGYEPLYLARDLEYWQSDEIRLIEYPASSEVLRAFRNKSLEAASLTLDEVLLLRQHKIPVSIVLVHDISDGADAIIARPPVFSMPQLKGKRIGVESGALGALVITRALELYGMSLQDVEIINLNVNRHESAFLKDEVDAVVTFEPVRTRLLNQNGREIFNSREIPSEIVDVLVVHREYLNKNPKVVKKMIKGWFKALNYLQQDRDKALNIIAGRLKLTPQEVEKSFEGLILPDYEENIRLLSPPEPLLGNTLENLKRIMTTHSILQPDVPTENLIDSGYLR